MIGVVLVVQSGECISETFKVITVLVVFAVEIINYYTQLYDNLHIKRHKFQENYPPLLT